MGQENRQENGFDKFIKWLQSLTREDWFKLLTALGTTLTVLTAIGNFLGGKWCQGVAIFLAAAVVVCVYLTLSKKTFGKLGTAPRHPDARRWAGPVGIVLLLFVIVIIVLPPARSAVTDICCGTATATPSPTPTPSPTSTPTETPAPTRTPTPTDTVSPTPTPSHTATFTKTPTSLPTLTFTPSPTPTTGCLTHWTQWNRGCLQGKLSPVRFGMSDQFCTETLTLAEPISATVVQIDMTRPVEKEWGYSIYEVEVYGPELPSANLALYHTVEASSMEGGWDKGIFLPELAIDGALLIPDGSGGFRQASRWASDQREKTPQWLQVNLGSVARVNRVVLKWERAYAVEYCVTLLLNK